MCDLQRSSDNRWGVSISGRRGNRLWGGTFSRPHIGVWAQAEGLYRFLYTAPIDETGRHSLTWREAIPTPSWRGAGGAAVFIKALIIWGDVAKW